VEIEDDVAGRGEAHHHLTDVSGTPEAPAAAVHVEHRRKRSRPKGHIDLCREIGIAARAQQDAFVEGRKLRQVPVEMTQVPKLPSRWNLLGRLSRRQADIPVEKLGNPAPGRPWLYHWLTRAM